MPSLATISTPESVTTCCSALKAVKTMAALPAYYFISLKNKVVSSEIFSMKMVNSIKEFASSNTHNVGIATFIFGILFILYKIGSKLNVKSNFKTTFESAMNNSFINFIYNTYNLLTTFICFYFIKRTASFIDGELSKEFNPAAKKFCNAVKNANYSAATVLTVLFRSFGFVSTIFVALSLINFVFDICSPVESTEAQSTFVVLINAITDLTDLITGHIKAVWNNFEYGVCQVYYTIRQEHKGPKAEIINKQ